MDNSCLLVINLSMCECACIAPACYFGMLAPMPFHFQNIFTAYSGAVGKLLLKLRLNSTIQPTLLKMDLNMDKAI
jgi:hypothetical protein